MRESIFVDVSDFSYSLSEGEAAPTPTVHGHSIEIRRDRPAPDLVVVSFGVEC